MANFSKVPLAIGALKWNGWECSPTKSQVFGDDVLKKCNIWWLKSEHSPDSTSVHNVLPKVKTTPTPWQRPEIMFVTGHGPFPTYLKRFNIRRSDSCGYGNLGNPLHYATSCLFTTSYHLTKPSGDLEPLWWKRVMNNNNPRAKIRKLIHFIAENSYFQKMATTTSHRPN
ncbi:hypothetical protein AVEN_40757-1 [Araneus ventricosus]|uniref:Uncharacterized protein n=1 Tax=Araneus ventricosus TaxID=182803 RepID=A0A4Y2W942_ARAVE|nr:hypothetical protein AVEN_40757-1 [Araneus ventricosus]